MSVLAHSTLKRLLAAVCVVAALALAACGSEDSSSDSTQAQGDKKVRVAYFAQFINDFTQAEFNGAKEVVEAAGGTITLFDGGGDATKQVNQIQDAVTSGNFDVLAIDPVDGAAVVPVVRAANEEGIKTVAVWSPIGKELLNYTPQVDGVATVVGQDISKNGEDIADLTIEACEGKDPCKVAFIAGFIAAPYERARLDAFKRRLATAPNIELVAVQAADYDEQKARAVTQNILQAHGDLDVLASAGEQMITGAITVLDKMGLGPDRLTLVSNGGGAKVLEQIKAGRVFASPVYTPFSLGRAAGEAAVKVGRGESVEPAIDASKLSPIGAIARRETIGDYRAEYAG